jgi:hypothetical protein
VSVCASTVEAFDDTAAAEIIDATMNAAKTFENILL